MTKTKTLYLALLAVLLSPMAANADLIDFDDLTAADGTFIPQGYNGFSWLGGSGTSSWVNNAAAPIDSSGAHSGTNYAWSNGGTQLDLSGTVFSISSLWVRNRDDVIAPQFRTYEGWLGGAMLYSFSQDATASWSEVSLSFSGIDKFVILTGHNILVDDIGIGISVPEPGTLALLGLGLVGMAARRRKV